MGVLKRFQHQLESIHGFCADGEVEDFLVAPEALQGPARAPEALLVSEQDGELSLGLYVDPGVLRELERPQPPLQLLLGRNLDRYCAAAEGVSHWLYLQHRASQDGPVSQLELEVQAEVDKFASCALGLWQLGLKGLCRHLRGRLFEQVSYRGHLTSQERERYQTANQLARAYAASLERRFVGPGRLEGLLRELRLSFRLGGGEKYARLAST